MIAFYNEDIHQGVGHDKQIHQIDSSRTSCPDHAGWLQCSGRYNSRFNQEDSADRQLSNIYRFSQSEIILHLKVHAGTLAMINDDPS
jgi:hypothetical protein